MFEKQIIKLTELRRNAMKYCVDAAMKSEGEITYLNSRSQLYNKGIRNDESSIAPAYSAEYKKVKVRLSLPSDHITLYQRGHFHGSFTLKPNENSVEITSAYKVNGFDLFEHLKKRYGDKIMGLTDANLKYVIDKIIQPAIDAKLEEAIS